MKQVLTILISSLAMPAMAGEITLQQPVDCELGENCYIQNYVDRDPTEGYRDFACSTLSYDSHKGTDFAAFSHEQAFTGIDVLAAAAGTVRSVRDEVPDHFFGTVPSFPEGQDCGNGVLIDHENGWQTLYCHMKLGSLVVRPGETVEAGTVLGEIGMSGNTAFPHLHMSLRHEGQVIDPFAVSADHSCDPSKADHLWDKTLPHTNGALMQTGFSFQIPDFDTVKFGHAHHAQLQASQGALVLWTQMFGAQPGDQLRLTIIGPEGVFSEKTVTLENAQAQAMRASGRKLHAGNTVPGDYQGTAVLLRQGQEIGRMTASTTLTE